jgi:hypothetical protein
LFCKGTEKQYEEVSAHSSLCNKRGEKDTEDITDKIVNLVSAGRDLIACLIQSLHFTNRRLYNVKGNKSVIAC